MNPKKNFAPVEFNSKEAQERLIAHFLSKGWDMPESIKEAGETPENLFWLTENDSIGALANYYEAEYEYNAKQLLCDLNIYVVMGRIIYSPEWITKILSGQKTMTIRRTQYPCGVYDVVSETEPDKVVCRIEVVKVEKWDTEYWLEYMMTHHYYNWANVKRSDLFSSAGSWDGYGMPPSYQKFPCFVKASGFSGVSCFEDFEIYHRENYAPVKFAHTFELVKGDDHDA